MQKSITSWLDITYKNYPDKLALKDDKESLNYKEYHDKAYGIAKEIIKILNNNKQPIIIYFKKSIKVLVSFLAVAYSGNFYSPIDYEMPKERVNKIIKTLNPKLVITTKELAKQFENFTYEGPYLFYEDIEMLEDDELVNDYKNKIIDTDLLYVLFTSGSTGDPKGVSIMHRSVIDYIDVIEEIFKIEKEDIFGNQAPFYFDNSILDIYICLKTGATLNIIPPDLFFQPVPLLEYLKENKINNIFWVPSALMIISKTKAFKNVDLTNILKRVLFCGEVMPNKQLNIWRKYLPNVIYANLYGPTEITDACTYYIVDREFEDDDILPIGKAFPNSEVFILDDDNNLIKEVGIKGELCVRGTSLAVGYYNNPLKTKEVFINNPLNNNYEEKIYRTGDYVQYNKYKEIIYLSRKDYQIKHLGYRIELGEIENATSSLKDITRCCCLYDDNKNKIILFIDVDMKKEEINKLLKDKLPDYMLPHKVIYLPIMPLNNNGKIDRLKLRELL